jgi:FdhD protein
MNDGSFDIVALRDSRGTHRDDRLAVEEPLEIRLGWYADDVLQEETVSVTMRTPGNDIELATGFLFSEGIVRDAGQLHELAHTGTGALRHGRSNVLRAILTPGVTPRLDRLRRHFYTSSACGVCGKASLEALETLGAEPLLADGFTLPAAALASLGPALAAAQTLYGATGGSHAAALFDCRGSLHHVHEDIGRHNALDKAIGSLLTREGVPAHGLGVLVSGRASFELLQKTAMAGSPMFVAVGAPSSLAVELAREFEITLVGFLRGTDYNVYSHPERILGIG